MLAETLLGTLGGDLTGKLNELVLITKRKHKCHDGIQDLK